MEALKFLDFTSEDTGSHKTSSSVNRKAKIYGVKYLNDDVELYHKTAVHSKDRRNARHGPSAVTFLKRM